MTPRISSIRHRQGVQRACAVLVAAAVAIALLATALLLATASQVAALPPDGAGPDTPGTSSRVWPSEVKPGDQLNFEVSGYPANETVYIKIDDGQMCSESSHGACVYAVQKLDASGSGSGSIIVPELSEGAHWLRMLATGDQFDQKTGEKIGYNGYTRRGGNDFTVVGSGSGGSSTGGSGSGSGAQSGSSSEAQSSEAGDVEGGKVEIDVDDEADVSGSGTDADLEDQMANISEGEEARLAAAAAIEAPADSGPPVLGIAVLAGAVVIGGGAVAWALIRRRKAARAAQQP